MNSLIFSIVLIKVELIETFYTTNYQFSIRKKNLHTQNGSIFTKKQTTTTKKYFLIALVTFNN